MRLLRFHGGKFSLKQFDGDAIPKYVILSHTWFANDEEVLFKDIEQQTGNAKAGYEKLTFCAERAQENALEWFWIDSCCIDKSSSSELSEAITSMFKWYSRAEKCCVYLSDVSTRKRDADGSACDWRLAFRRSRWHLRGWTLQELLAPRVVEFWSRDQVKIGDRGSLEHEIHQITNIPTRALRGDGLQSFAANEKYGWMRDRQTKLEEDQIYCLLGLFTVFIPIIYGEGLKSARQRLNDAITRAFENDMQQKTGSALSREFRLLSSAPDGETEDEAAMLKRQWKRQRERCRQLLQSLKVESFDLRRQTITQAQPGTCEWLLDHQQYKDWLQPGNIKKHHGFLWIKGKPGAGKSTLMKVIHSRAVKSKQSADIILSFFFNARGVESEKTTLGMWKALLHQLMTSAPDLQAILDEVHTASTDPTAPPWTVQNLSEAFSNGLQKLGSRNVQCFIDALDECDERDIRVMIDCFEQIGEDAVRDGRQPRVCFASRHYPHISLRLGQQIILEDERGHSKDLARYIERHFKLPKSGEANQVTAQVQAKANGVFLWVVLAVRILNAEFDRGRMYAVEEKLRQLPHELIELFEDMLRRDNENMNETLLACQWILFAAEPLTAEEYYCAVVSGTDSDPNTSELSNSPIVTEKMLRNFITTSSMGLAEVPVSNSRVQFIHESVRDFLLKDGGFDVLSPGGGENVLSISHSRLRDVCHGYLRANGPKFLADRYSTTTPVGAGFWQRGSDPQPFIRYAINYVLFHADRAAASAGFGEFLENFDLELWLQVESAYGGHDSLRYTDAASLLHFLARHDCGNLIRAGTPNKPSTGPQGEEVHYPLLAAAKCAKSRAFQVLLQLKLGSDVAQSLMNIGDMHADDSHPLSCVLSQRNNDLAGFLLQASDLRFADLQDQEVSRIVYLAAQSGYEAVIHWVAANVDITNFVGHPDHSTQSETELLTAAASNGHDDMFRLLLNIRSAVVHNQATGAVANRDAMLSRLFSSTRQRKRTRTVWDRH